MALNLSSIWYSNNNDNQTKKEAERILTLVATAQTYQIAKIASLSKQNVIPNFLNNTCNHAEHHFFQKHLCHPQTNNGIWDMG
jgi:hypothetical protein